MKIREFLSDLKWVFPESRIIYRKKKLTVITDRFKKSTYLDKHMQPEPIVIEFEAAIRKYKEEKMVKELKAILDKIEDYKKTVIKEEI